MRNYELEELSDEDLMDVLAQIESLPSEEHLTEMANKVIQANHEKVAATVAEFEAKGYTLYDFVMGDAVGGSMAIAFGGVDRDLLMNIASMQAKAARQAHALREAQEATQTYDITVKDIPADASIAVEAVVAEDALLGQTQFPSNA